VSPEREDDLIELHSSTGARGADTEDRSAGSVSPSDAAQGEGQDETRALRAERDDLQDRLLRLAAEFDNYRKRSAREWREQKDRAAAEVLREMLELADNLERALAAPEQEQSLRKGVELTLQQLQVKLKRFGVEAMEARGQEFDPTRHEAVLMVDVDDVESQHVVDVVQQGYLLNGEVLRPARVTVAR
jgi:molecular chaperone GrpE